MPMHAFLFDAEHPEVSDLFAFGPPCTQRVVAALEGLAPVPTARLIRGKVIPEHICYDLSGFALGEKEPRDSGPLLTSADPNTDLLPIEYHRVSREQAVRSDRYAYSPNMELFTTVVCDLAESLCVPPSTAREDVIFLHLARGLIWSVGTSNTSDEEATFVDQQLRGFGPYLGNVKLDPGNPIQWHIMVEQMFHEDVFLGPEGISFRLEPGLLEDDRDEAEYLARNLGSGKQPALLEWDEFAAKLPPLKRPKEFSRRGELSRQRITGKMTRSHRQRLALALLDHFEKTRPDERIEFSTALDHDVKEFELDQKKFTKYLFNREHKDGGGKAKFFIEMLGIQSDDWRFLADQIERGVQTAPIYRAGKNQWGFTHGAFVMVTGRNGKTSVLETGWMIISGQPAKFVTAYPFDGEVDKQLLAPNPFVVGLVLTGDARWKAIYERACEEGRIAASSVQPTPMVLEQYGAVWDGLCGFAWVGISDARHPMAKWLVKSANGHKSRSGVRVSAQLPCQSVERKRAWADAFAAVLKANGIECTADSRLD